MTDTFVDDLLEGFLKPYELGLFSENIGAVAMSFAKIEVLTDIKLIDTIDDNIKSIITSYLTNKDNQIYT